MGEDARITIKLQPSLMDAVEPFLNCKNEFGIAFWDSKTKFVAAAVQHFIKAQQPLLRELEGVQA